MSNYIEVQATLIIEAGEGHTVEELTRKLKGKNILIKQQVFTGVVHQSGDFESWAEFVYIKSVRVD